MPRPATPPLSPASLFALLLFFALSLGVSALGGAVTAGPVRDWYPGLAKPALTPPDIAFPIVWTILFAMMALAAWLTWRRGGWQGTRGALLLFGLQLALNFGWSLLFFGLQRIDLAVIEIVILLAAIAATIAAFARHSLPAAALLLPYLAWVGFAAWLTFSIWRLN